MRDQYSAARPIKTTYYGAAGPGETKPVVATTRGSRIEEAAPNVTRFMTRKNRHLAVVAEVIDTTYGELLMVATMFPGEPFTIQFERDVHRPILITNYE